MKRRNMPCRRGGQRGVAALIVVMVLFFVVSLVAAYASRNLIFEQRTSANQYRSTQAIEAAEAGLRWATALLNGGRITAACLPSTVSTDNTFRQRYLTVSNATGIVGVVNPNLAPTCVASGTTWSCSCPVTGAATTATVSDGAVHPSFRVRFTVQSTTQPGIVRIESNGCTNPIENCLTFNTTTVGFASGDTNEGRAYVTAQVALIGGAVAPPVAGLTALGSVNLTGGAIYNSDIAVQASGPATVDPSVSLSRAPGTPGNALVSANDADLNRLFVAPTTAPTPPISPTDRFFATTFNMLSGTYRNQPGVVVMDCSAGCDAATLRTTIQDNPGRPFWLNGDLNIGSAGDIASAAAPVVMVVTGNVNTTVTGATLYGLLYVQNASWASAGSLQVQGAVLVEGNLTTGAPVLAYDTGVLNALRYTSGSFVLVPGSWQDFPLDL